jgi:predicted transcriptional regulator
MAENRERAHDMAEEGLDKIIEGDEEKGRQMIDEAKKRDPKAVEELAEEVERDREQAEHFIDKK